MAGSDPGQILTVLPVRSPGETVALRAVVTAYGRLSALASGGADVSRVTRLLGDTIGADVAVLGPTLAVLAAATDPQADVVERLRSYTGRRGLAPVLTAAGGLRRAMTLPGLAAPVSSAVIAPITAGDEVVAYLVTFTGGRSVPTEDGVLMLAEHAAMVCGVVLGRERVAAAAAGRARMDLIEGVLNGHARFEGDLSRWASHLGFEEGRDHHVLVAGARRGAPAAATHDHAAHATIESFLGHHAPDGIVATRSEEVVAIIPGPTGSALPHVKNLAARCRAAVDRHHRGVIAGFGIGGHCTQAAGIAESYSQARRSLETTRRRAQQGGVVAFAELGIQRLLLQVPDVTALQAFAHEVLGSALEQDAAAGSEHLRTLSAYFQENCSPRRAAAALHVHPNTVSYRIRRIEDLTGLSLDAYRDRLLAQVAVAILVPPEET